MKYERAKRIPLRPMGTSSTLGEEFEKNSPPGLGGVAKAEGGTLKFKIQN